MPEPLLLAPGDERPLARPAPGIYGLRCLMVNVYALHGPNGWFLVDAGLPFSAAKIAAWAAGIFGNESRPEAILLTHGHFDHVGGLKTLAAGWDVPVYAHELELPYVTGKKAYPPPDPTVDRGAFSWMSFLYPRGPVDAGSRVRPLPADGTIPGLAGWRWVHTPGHTEGHVSFFRESDRVLVAGDAAITTQQESVGAVLTQRPQLSGPPAYFTSNWRDARRSVQALADLKPTLLASGHGVPCGGHHLDTLAREFDRYALPDHGYYLEHPTYSTHARPFSPAPVAAALGIVALAGWAAYRRRN